MRTLPADDALFAACKKIERLEAVLSKVRTDLMERAAIAAERKDAATDAREREFYKGQSGAFELAALMIPLNDAGGSE